jgi:hypothetical protein
MISTFLVDPEQNIKSLYTYLLPHSVVQKWLEYCENDVKNPGLVKDVNSMCPYWETGLKTKG